MQLAIKAMFRFISRHPWIYVVLAFALVIISWVALLIIVSRHPNPEFKIPSAHTSQAKANRVEHRNVAMNRGKETNETLITTDDTEQKLLSYFSDFSANQYFSG